MFELRKEALFGVILIFLSEGTRFIPLKSQSPWKWKKTYKNCQSCGMPFKRVPLGGGTNADGSTSTTYCSKCYQAGQFTQPEITVDGMKQLVKGKLKEFGFPGFLAGIFTRNIPKLERWRTAG